MRNFEEDRLKFEPCAEGIAVTWDGELEKTSGGIYLSKPNESKFPARGTIVALSKEASEGGYAIGDRILYNQYLAEDVAIEDVNVDILLLHNVLGKILL